MKKFTKILVGSLLATVLLTVAKPAHAGNEGDCANVIGTAGSCSNNPTTVYMGKTCHLSSAYYVPINNGPYNNCCTYKEVQHYCNGSYTGTKEYFVSKSEGRASCTANGQCLSA